MVTIYLVETKTFYTRYDGFEYQLDDVGHLPMLFTSLKKGMSQMNSCRKVHTEIFNETIIKNYRPDEIKDDDCLDRFETRHNITGSRTIVSLYKKKPNY